MKFILRKIGKRCFCPDMLARCVNVEIILKTFEMLTSGNDTIWIQYSQRLLNSNKAGAQISPLFAENGQFSKKQCHYFGYDLFSGSHDRDRPSSSGAIHTARALTLRHQVLD